MRRRLIYTFLLLIVCVLAGPRLASAELVWAIVDDDKLVVFDVFDPGTILLEVPITGLQPDESLRAIDFRPRDGQLYGYGSSQRIYRIHPLTGVATTVSAAPMALAPSASQDFGFDFDPVADEIRFIGSNLNFRVNPANGEVIDSNPGLPGVQGHLIPLPIGNYVAAAYTNNYPGATATTLFVIAANTDRLGRLGGVGGTPSPNLGTVTDIGPLDEATNGHASLDASLPTDNLWAWVNSVGFGFIDKATGEMQGGRAVGPGTGLAVHDLAVLALPASLYALTADRRLLRFKNHAPGTVLGETAITGLVDQAAGELLHAIALRASTGRLYALSDRARLYTIDPLTGAATFLNDLGTLTGASFAMDFDPATDQLRIMSDDGLNWRVHAETFVVTEGANLSRGVDAMSYTHLPPAGSGQTLFGIADGLYVHIGGLGGTPPPDSGTVTSLDPVGFPPPPQLGMDISVADNMALAAGRISGTDGLALLNSRNGNAAPIDQIPNSGGAVIGLSFAPRGHVQFTAPSLTVSENAGTVLLTVQRTNGSDGLIAVDYTVTGGTATAVSDYTVGPDTLVFNDGETSKTIPLGIANNATPESPETVILTLTTPTLGARLGATTTINVTINDDDVPPNPPPTITIVNPTDQPTYVAQGALITLRGNALDDTGIATVTWVNDQGGNGVAQGTSPWTAIDIPLQFGANTITVTATDTGGAQASDAITVTVTELSYLLAEGATGTFFDLDILLANPHVKPAPITVTFLKEGGSTLVQTLTLPATSRTTLRVDQIPGLEGTAVSTIVTSTEGLPLVVERTMRWDATGYGAHTEKAVEAPATTWYFAEGSQGFFSTYILLANPDTNPNRAEILYLREGTSPVTRTYDLAPRSRVTVDAGADPALVNNSFGMIVTFDLPGVAERAMYFGTAPLWTAGHESAGVTQPALEWFLAEGATGPFFETFILLANPQTTSDAEVTLTYLRSSGAPITRTKTIPAAGRLTVNAESEDPGLANTAFGTQVVSSVPIVVERAQYWPFAPAQWYEAHNSFGTTSLGTKWGLAEGRVGGPNNYQTYILLANPGSTAADVTITFLRTNGSTVTKSFTVAAFSRFNVAPGPGGAVPELSNEEFAAVIASTQPIAVERAMYLDVGGATWAAGTNATGTRLP